VVADEQLLGDGGVALVIADAVDAETTRKIRSRRRRGVERIALLVGPLDDTDASMRSTNRRVDLYMWALIY
jgi:hypothetical protein